MAHVQRKCAKCRRSVPEGRRACPACRSRDAAWLARYVGPDHRERSRSFERKVDAEQFLIRQESAKQRGEWIDPAAGKMMLGEFVESKWQGSTLHLAAHNRRRYGSLLRAHILPALGSLPLSRISLDDVKALVSTMQSKGSAPKTVHHAYTLLSGILRSAQDSGRIVKLPTQRRKVGLPRLGHMEQRYLTHEQVAELAATEPIAPQYSALVFLGAYGALRYGEIAGLRVRRLRMLERKVDVVETDQGTARKWGSSGTVTLPAFVAERLAEHLAAFPPGPDGLVFTAPRGGPLHYADFYRRRWCKAQETLGWGTWVGKRFTPEYRIHDLRHTAVALAIAAGAHPKEIHERCRHRSITTTLNEYGHLFPQLHERLAERLDEAARAAAAGPRRD